MDEFKKMHDQIRLSIGDSVYFQDEILHAAAHRKIILPLVLTRLSDEETEKTTLYIPNICF